MALLDHALIHDLVLAKAALVVPFIFASLVFQLVSVARRLFRHWRQCGSRRGKVIRNLSMFISWKMLRDDFFNILFVLLMFGLRYLRYYFRKINTTYVIHFARIRASGASLARKRVFGGEAPGKICLKVQHVHLWVW